jgi:DNA replication and repair protein RecF
MRVERLGITNLRCIESLGLEPGPGLNAILGPNGAGKTSVLEALHVLSHGHSFRRRARDGLIRRDSGSFMVRAEIGTDRGAHHSIALQRSRDGWAGRLDGSELERLGDLFAVFATCAFTPGSHELIDGGAEVRRAFWDWGVFHVEPEFLDDWRRYVRAMRQRNALLREGAPDRLFEPFEREMARAGERIAAWRAGYLAALEPRVRDRAQQLLPELGACALHGSAGYRIEQGGALATLLAERRAVDRARGTTTAGPHRADWALRFADRLEAAQLSRGQQKLMALAMVLAQADVYAAAKGHWPVLLLDDLASELDDPHQAALLETLAGAGMQVILTGTGWTPALAQHRERMTVFHVEHGRRIATALEA